MRRFRAAGRLLWRAQPGAAAGLILGAIALGGVPVAAAWLTKSVLDRLSGSGQPLEVGPVAIALVLVLLIGQLGQGLLRYAQDQLTNRMELDAQAELFSAINRHPGLELFERPSFHDALQLAQRATQLAPSQLLQVTQSGLVGTTSLLGFLGVLIAVSPVIAILAAAAAGPHLAAELRLSRQRIALYRSLSPAQRRTVFYARLQSDPQAAKEVRIFGLGSFFRDRMVTELRSALLSERRLARRVVKVQCLLDGCSAVVTGACVIYVISLASDGRSTAGDVIVVLTALPGLALAVVGLVQNIAQATEALNLVEHLQQVIDLAPTARPAKPAGPLRSGIRLEDVWFRYGEDLPWVLKGVTVELPLGRSVGLVGTNGAGKSTIVKLLARLYEPTRGRITWDGTDLRELDHESLRARLGVVSQDYMTYDLSALENIGLGDLSRMDDRQRIQNTARAAGVHELIIGYPHGYDTMLSRVHGNDADDGVMPSGGQWQRFALARMLMRSDRELLILDEPSSNLDPEAEHEVHQLVNRLTAGATRLLVSHRLNAVRMADHIVVLEDGMITEQGGHDNLIAGGGRYAGLFHRQAAGYRD